MVVTANHIRIYLNPNIDDYFLPKSWKSDFSEKKKIQKGVWSVPCLNPELFLKHFLNQCYWVLNVQIDSICLKSC